MRKFLAGVTTIAIVLVAIVLIISGLGIRLIGVVPGAEEIWRLVIYLVVSILYISFWLGISILFSVVFRSTATSALASLALWIFFSFFVSLGAGVLADAIAPVSQSAGAEPGCDYETRTGPEDHVFLFSHDPLQGCHLDDSRPHEKDDEIPDPDGPHGEALLQPFPESASPFAEPLHRGSLI